MVKKKRAPLPFEAPVILTPVPDPVPMALEAARSETPAGCIICGEESAPISSEGLCWVCRRLKLSAWRDTDTQMSAQE